MKHKLLIIFGLMLLVITAPIAAQSELDETFVADDDTFQISYPADWTISDDNPAYIILSGVENRDRMSFTVFSTETINLFAIGEDAAVDVAANVAEIFTFVQDDADEFEIEGRDVGLASVDLEGQPGAAFIIEMSNGDYGMVIVLADDEALEDNVDFILNVVASYNTPEGTGGKGEPDLGGGNGDTPQSLSSHDGDWEDAIAELQDLGVIGTGGSLVFEEDSAFFTGQGFFFTPLGRRAPYADIVMAGQIEFTSGSSTEYEECSLLARVVDEGQSQVGTYLQVGVDNAADVFYYDTISSEDSTLYEPFPANLDLDESHHFLFILVDESLTVYVDGELLIDNVEVNDERAGTYGIALMGSSRDSRCEGSNLWVYQVPSFEAGVCEVSASGSVNKRSGPGTNFDRAGTLEPGTILEVIGQSTASDGFIWWELEDGSWVRDDIVNAVGDCASVPESE